jgi:hypothetical protein
MSEKKHEYEKDKELDCEITVNEGAHMTCDMTEEESKKKEDKPPDYAI